MKAPASTDLQELHDRLNQQPVQHERFNSTAQKLLQVQKYLGRAADEEVDILQPVVYALALKLVQWHRNIVAAGGLVTAPAPHSGNGQAHLELEAEALILALELLDEYPNVGAGYLGALLGHIGELKSKFDPVKEVPRGQIMLRPDLFQGRQTEYSQETVDKIMREGYDKSREPIEVWFDKKANKYVVISGHSRWEGSERRFRAGQKDLATMPVKAFRGTFEEAQDYAILESNRSGTAEGLLSDLAAYKRAVERGKNHGYLMSIFKSEGRIKQLRDLTYLNPKGLFIDYLAQAAQKSFPYLERNAQWVGQLRAQFPQLTNSHEREMWDYMYGKQAKEIPRRDDFFKLIQKKVGNMFWTPDQPLNLHNVASTGAYANMAADELNRLQSELDQLQERRLTLETNIQRVKSGEGEVSEKRLSEWVNELSLTHQNVLRKIEQIARLQAEQRRVDQNMHFDLFNPPPAPVNETLPPAPQTISDEELLELEAEALMLELELLSN